MTIHHDETAQQPFARAAGSPRESRDRLEVTGPLRDGHVDHARESFPIEVVADRAEIRPAGEGVAHTHQQIQSGCGPP